MLEKPDISDEKIITCLKFDYGLSAPDVIFLPLGNDSNTVAYKVHTSNNQSYFLKLRTGNFDDNSVTVPTFLKDEGIKHIIPPIETTSGNLLANLGNHKIILYPFVEGKSGFDVLLSDQQWFDFGNTLKSIHKAKIPTELKNQLRSETFSPKWLDVLKMFLKRIINESFEEPTAAKMAVFLKTKSEEITSVIEKTEKLRSIVKERNLPFVLCHYDIHAGNLLIDGQDNIFIVDWDNPILAPKERDLMFIGSGIGYIWNTEKESKLFYKGYGEEDIDPVAIVYYRYVRLIEDIAIYAQDTFLTDEGGKDRERNLEYLKHNFLPENVLDLAKKSEKLLPQEIKAQLAEI